MLRPLRRQPSCPRDFSLHSAPKFVFSLTPNLPRLVLPLVVSLVTASLGHRPFLITQGLVKAMSEVCLRKEAFLDLLTLSSVFGSIPSPVLAYPLQLVHHIAKSSPGTDGLS